MSKMQGFGHKRVSEQKGKTPLPTQEQLEAELLRVKRANAYRSVFRGTIFALVTVAAAAILVATLWLPVFQIYGNSMTPTLHEGEYVVALKGSSFKTGDVVAINYGSRILVKRVIAGPGSWVDIDDDGVVTVNGKELKEPYLEKRSFGKCDIELPCQVPDDSYFVMGDHRETSVDSRSAAVGCIARADIVGKITATVWPLPNAGLL